MHFVPPSKTYCSPARTHCYGIDLLRILAAFYVIVLHSLQQGGILQEASDLGSSALVPSRFLFVSALCAVNIFGLISGYVGYSETDKPYSPVNHMMLWLQIVFYAVGITLLFQVTRPDVTGTRVWLSSFLPLCTNLYWYFTSYSVLLPFIPLLNTAVRHSQRGTLLLLLLVIIFLLSPYESLTGKLFFYEGLCFGWLAILYLCGAIMKKEHIGAKLKPGFALLGILVIDVCLYLLKSASAGSTLLQRLIGDSVIESYCFPLHLISGMLHVILFAKLPTGKIAQAIIRFAAPGAFSVYIVNTHPLIWHHVNRKRFVSWAAKPGWEVVLFVLLHALLYCLGVVVVDFIRRKFLQLLRVKPRLQGIYSALLGFMRRRLPFLLDQ